jgi:hypothetical protein
MKSKFSGSILLDIFETLGDGDGEREIFGYCIRYSPSVVGYS